jgi:hypothetical protein
MVFYFYQKLGLEPERLPIQEGFTWPTTTLQMHVRPKLGEVKTGSILLIFFDKIVVFSC